MKKLNLKAVKREQKGKEINKKIRKEGMVSGIIYGKNFNNLMIKIDSKELKKVLTTSAGTRIIVNLAVEDGINANIYTTMVTEVQKDVYQKVYLHVDFQKISMDEIIHIEVPINLTGESKGVKEGCMMDHLIREVMVKGLPLEIPEKINIDVTNMEADDKIFIKDLKASENIEIMGNPEDLVAVVHPPKVAEITESEEEEAEKESTEAVGAAS